MDKLQVRLERAQVELVLEALNEMIIGGPYDDERDGASTLHSWLTWRRDKFWSPAGSGKAALTADEALRQLRDKLSG